MKAFQPERPDGPGGTAGTGEIDSEAESSDSPVSKGAAANADESDADDPAFTILVNVLSREGDETALDDARRNIDSIERYLLTLDHEEPNILDKIVTDDLNPEWFALVLDVLGRSSPVIDLAGIEPLLRGAADDEKSIGYAMRDVFLADLPQPLLEFDSWYASIDRIDRTTRKQREFLEWLEGRPSLEAFREDDGGFGCWEPLLMRGITPVTILRATEAVAGIIDPILRPAHALQKLEFLISDDYRRIELPSYDIELIEGEVALMCECTSGMAHLILRWLIAASVYKPYMFDACTATIEGGDADAMMSVKVVYTGEEIPDLCMRWRTIR